jgi:hypothetical protein
VKNVSWLHLWWSLRNAVGMVQGVARAWIAVVRRTRDVFA